MELHILCGIPGSGKSTLAQSLSGFIVSTDNIRKFLWNDVSIVEHDKLVFNLADSIIEYMLSLGKSVIFDATNATFKRRKKYINLAKRYGAVACVHWIDIPLQLAIDRNFKRDRKVPIAVIESIYEALKVPDLKEGMDIIKIYDENLNITKIIRSVENM